MEIKQLIPAGSQNQWGEYNSADDFYLPPPAHLYLLFVSPVLITEGESRANDYIFWWPE